MRDIKADYKRSYIADYEGYVRTGNTEAAETTAAILRDHYDHEVAPKPAEPPREPETTKAEAPPETTAEPKPKSGKKKR